MNDKLMVTEWQEPLERIKESQYGDNLTWREVLQAEIDAQPELFRMATNDEDGTIAIVRKVAL